MRLAAPSPTRDEPTPIVAAWEEGSGRFPSFVLYEDGSWIIRPDLNEPGLRAGHVTRERARELHERVMEADLLAQRPWQTRTPYSSDSSSTTYCTSVRAGWTCAVLEGMDPRTAWRPPNATGPAPIRFGQSGYTLPVPPAFTIISEVIESIDLAGGGPWLPDGCTLEAENSEPHSSRVPPSMQWPVEVAPPSIPPPGQVTRRSLSEEDCAPLRERTRHQPRTVQVGETALVVAVQAPRLPNQELLLAVRNALWRFLHPEW